MDILLFVTTQNLSNLFSINKKVVSPCDGDYNGRSTAWTIFHNFPLNGWISFIMVKVIYDLQIFKQLQRFPWWQNYYFSGNGRNIIWNHVAIYKSSVQFSSVPSNEGFIYSIYRPPALQYIHKYTTNNIIHLLTKKHISLFTSMKQKFTQIGQNWIFRALQQLTKFKFRWMLTVISGNERLTFIHKLIAH